MSRINELKRRLDSFKAEGDLKRDTSITRLTKVFLERARHNLETGKVLFSLSNDSEAKDVAGIRENFECFDWAIITGYYAMYHATLALLSTQNLKSENHTATILAFEYYFIHKQGLNEEYLKLLKQAQLQKDDTRKLRAARNRRETAQYDVEESYQKRQAQKILKDATEFVNKTSTIIRP